MTDVFDSTDSYLEQYAKRFPAPPSVYIGILYSRSNWATGNLGVETALISSLEEKGLGVIPVFLYSLKDANMGNLSGVEVIERYLVRDGKPIVEGIVKLTSFFLGSSRGEMKAAEASGGANLMKGLGIPLFGPVISYYKDREQWTADPTGPRRPGGLECCHARVRGCHPAHGRGRSSEHGRLRQRIV